ncbi:hypothetical protein JTE90_025686 [Oedothorax gibbosus]|uniref:Uncharacterized protein n=1 Tax=Oedothorax gibbosus TaxID=931172 RepID=A0AAV6UCZ2_9ARAC|nr:hypothetical protein JTE90_025686 [Oedothorax gibbosus]
MIDLNNLKTVVEGMMNPIDRSLDVGKANQAKENAERLKPIIETRQKVLHEKIESLAPKTKKQKLKQLCPTRWVKRHDAVLVMKELYNPIISSLAEIKCWDDKDTSSGADVLLTAICQSESIVALVSAEKILSYTFILCQKLQSSDADLWAALNC